jgi:RNA polymerase sigma factor (sigma-70 family)
MNGATQLLEAAAKGDPQAAEKLLPLVYDELRELAAAKLAQEKPGQTLDATALVHEAYLRLVGSTQGARDSGLGAEAHSPGVFPVAPSPQPPVPSYNSRAHFFRAAAEAMRRVLVDNARRKRSEKRGGEYQRLQLCDPPARDRLPEEDIVAISEALHELERIDQPKAELVKLRYFAGLTLVEAAEVLGISRATADRYWAYAKVWLYRELHAAAGGPENQLRPKENS